MLHVADMHVVQVTAATMVGPLMCHVLDLALGGRRRLHRVVDLNYGGGASQSPSGLGVGPVSSYIGRLAPYVVSPAAIYRVTDEPTAMHLHALFALAERQVDRVEAMISTLVYAFWAHVEQHWRRLCDEIESGTLIRGQLLAAMLSRPHPFTIHCSTKKVTPCIHCHNSDKQCQILTEFWTNNAILSIANQTANLNKICQRLQ